MAGSFRTCCLELKSAGLVTARNAVRYDRQCCSNAPGPIPIEINSLGPSTTCTANAVTPVSCPSKVGFSMQRRILAGFLTMCWLVCSQASEQRKCHGGQPSHCYGDRNPYSALHQPLRGLLAQPVHPEQAGLCAPAFLRVAPHGRGCHLPHPCRALAEGWVHSEGTPSCHLPPLRSHRSTSPLPTENTAFPSPLHARAVQVLQL